MDLRDIAVTVRERAHGEFGWVLLEGTGESGPFAAYVRLAASEQTYPGYFTALAAGIVALRAMGNAARGPRRQLDPP